LPLSPMATPPASAVIGGLEGKVGRDPGSAGGAGFSDTLASL